MRPTPQERLLIYERALDIYQGDDWLGRSGLCSVVNRATIKLSHENKIPKVEGSVCFVWIIDLDVHFPELYYQKPAKTYDTHFWWHHSEWEVRIKALNKAIEITQMEIDNEINENAQETPEN